MIETLSWYGIITLLGLLVLPLSFAIFRRLPDRGYTFSKPLGLLVVGIAAWWVGNLKLLPFVGSTIWLVVALVGLACYGLLLANRRLREEMLAWFRQPHNLWLIVAGELLFLAAFAFMVNFRSFLPDLNQSEKFFDLAFIQAIATSPTLPPPDPWYGGVPMNYYYGGQLLMAIICKLSGVEASTAYNIAMGLVFALATLGGFGIACNLVGLARGKNRVSIGAGLIGAAFLMILGNLLPLRQFLEHGLLPLGDRNFPFKVNWPASARMIYDPMPDGRMLDILTEYPIYSYLNGDLHAHLLDAPYVLLVLGYIVNIFSAPAKWALTRLDWRAVPRFLAAGLLIGAPFLINGGDFPTYLFLAVAVLGLAELRAGGKRLEMLVRWGVQVAGLGAAIWLVYLFYFTNFTGMLRAEPDPTYQNVPVVGYLSRFMGWINWPRTFLAEYVQMFGLFLLAILTFYALKLAELWREEKEEVAPLPTWANVLVKVAGLIFLAIGLLGLIPAYQAYSVHNLSLKSAIVPVIALSAAAWTLWPGAWQQLRSRPRLAMEAMYLIYFIPVGIWIHFELLGPVSILTYLSLRLFQREFRRSKESENWLARMDSLLMLFVALGGALILFCEVVYIKDIYANRFNTMFKFWYQVWVLNSLAGTYAAWRVLSWVREWQPGGAKSGLENHRQAQSSGERLGGLLPKPLLNFSFLGSQRRQLADGPDLDRDWSFSVSQPAGRYPPKPSRPAIKPVFAGAGSDEREESETAAKPRLWKGFWLAAMAALIFFAALLPTIAYYQGANYYQQRKGLDGEAWYARQFPAEYPAMVWLRNYTANNAERSGVVLEMNGINYTWADRISTFTGLPTVVGWPFHELQWRGYLDPLVIWNSWLDMSRIYETTDEAKAIQMLKEHNVRYVFVGQVENGTRSFYPDNHDLKHFSPEALAKFRDFMTPIYSDPQNNVYIYEFK
ncbi:MAG TPA: DUF2298 domain-containing protein [Chloroflexia bacterium]|nr:DUF2298 domain-containing protein [Chloroflexia bacterium]